MDSIPYIEHSFLSIDRKIFVKYRTFPFFLLIFSFFFFLFFFFSFFIIMIYFIFLEFLISKAAYHKHPTPYDLLGGRSPFESNKVSSRGFIATFILKESEEPTFSQ